MAKKVLIISYAYPPIVEIGSLRALGFSKHLPEFDWEPYVISVKNPDRFYCVVGDESSPANVKTYYTYSLFNLTRVTGKINGILLKILKLFKIKFDRPLLRNLFCIPDQFIGWIPLTFLKGYSLIKRYKIDLVYVSSKPFSPAIVGAMLKFTTKKPLVLDFRDPVSPLFLSSKEKYFKYLPIFHLVKKIEEMLLRYTDKLIVVTEQTKKVYLSTFPFLKGRIDMIYNGFMEEYFLTQPEPFREFTIVYSGNFYEEMLPPDPFFKALQELIKQDTSLKNKIHFLFVEKRYPWLKEMISKYNLTDVIEVTGLVSRKESVEYICKSSILLLRNASPMLTTKLFEGLAGGVPLLALINEDEAEQLIREYSLAHYYIVKPEDFFAIAEAIKDAYNKWRNGGLIRKRNPEFYKKFNKMSLTAEFAKILNELVR